MTPTEQDQVHQTEARQILREAWVDDVAQKMAMNRAVYAAGYGIDPRPFCTPRPVPEVAATTMTRSRLAPLALAAMSGLGLGGIGILAASLLGQAAPAPAAASAELEPIKGEIRFWVEEDGEVNLERPEE